MLPHFANGTIIALFVSISGISFAAAPKDFDALPLVPPGAQVVAGLDVKQYSRGGSLQLVTSKNVLDLEDWISISGVDPERSFDQIIQVSFAPGEDLSEHLLLITGHFSRNRIFRSASLNGAKPLKYLNESVLSIEPFARELDHMDDTRLLAILENRIAMLGTPRIVKQALLRYENRVPADPVLIARLARFEPDVTSWNQLIPLQNGQESIFLESTGPLSTIFEDAEILQVGVRLTSKVRLDLSVQAGHRKGTTNAAHKVALIGRMFYPELVREEDMKRHLKNIQVDANSLRVSVILRLQDFEAWKHDAVERQRQLLEEPTVKQARAAQTYTPDGFLPPAN